MKPPQVSLQIPDKLLPLLEPHRFKIMHGGRGGAKSHTVAQVLAAKGLQGSTRILCAREIQKSIEKSSFQVIKDYIERLGIGEYYRLTRTHIEARTTKTVFDFTGLQDHTADSIKSFEGVDITWVEEAHKVSPHSWNILIPTVLRQPGAELWATFNPDQKADYVYDRWVAHDDPDAWVCEINWRDNPWFPKALDDERRRMQALNDDLYRHIWEGECRSAAGILFKRDWFRFYDSAPTNLSTYLASDYAVTPPDDSNPAPDWTEHGVFGLDERGEIWILDWWSGQTAPEEWIEAALSLVKRYRPGIWFDESGVIRRAVDASINRRMRERNAWVSRQGLPSASSKAARALGFAARASAGVVHLPKTEWAERLVNQLCAFTGEDGRVDDMVDVCSLIARGLDMMGDAMPLPKDERPPPPFSERWFDERERLAGRTQIDKTRAYR